MELQPPSLLVVGMYKTLELQIKVKCFRGAARSRKIHIVSVLFFSFKLKSQLKCCVHSCQTLHNEVIGFFSFRVSHNFKLSLRDTVGLVYYPIIITGSDYCSVILSFK